MVNAINSWTSMTNAGMPGGNGPTPTIKVVNWASGTTSGLAASTLADAAEGGELGSELGLAGTLGGALGGAYSGGIGYYNQASANVPKQSVEAIANDIAGSGYDPGSVTLIGHSLGAEASIDAGFDYDDLTRPATRDDPGPRSRRTRVPHDQLCRCGGRRDGQYV